MIQGRRVVGRVGGWGLAAVIAVLAAAALPLFRASESPALPRLWLDPAGTPVLIWSSAPAAHGRRLRFFSSEVRIRPLKGPAASAEPKQAVELTVGLQEALHFHPEGARHDVVTTPSGQVWLAGVRMRSGGFYGREWWGRPFVHAVTYQPTAESPLQLRETQPLPTAVLADYPDFLKAHSGARDVRLLAASEPTPWLVATTLREPHHVFIVRSREDKWLAPRLLAEGRRPAPVRNPAGRYHVFFQAETGVARVSSRDGIRWSKPQALPAAQDGQRPAVAVGARRLWLVWSAGPKESADLYLAQSRDDGDTWTQPRRLTSSEESADMQPAILVDRDNTVWIAFIRQVGETKELRTLHFAAD